MWAQAEWLEDGFTHGLTFGPWVVHTKRKAVGHRLSTMHSSHIAQMANASWDVQSIPIDWSMSKKEKAMYLWSWGYELRPCFYCDHRETSQVPNHTCPVSYALSVLVTLMATIRKDGVAVFCECALNIRLCSLEEASITSVWEVSKQWLVFRGLGIIWKARLRFI